MVVLRYGYECHGWYGQNGRNGQVGTRRWGSQCAMGRPSEAAGRRFYFGASGA
ncbi:MAG: hypothetical protein HZB26_24415 [Candidatus Hydrogenedentes bacterium]|nr:hypothetical protein [Candidatus Hydrogenedentota bacterium]